MFYPLMVIAGLLIIAGWGFASFDFYGEAAGCFLASALLMLIARVARRLESEKTPGL